MLAIIQNSPDKSTRMLVERIYDEYSGDMLRFAASRFRRAGVCETARYAEDAVQNAFVKILKYARSISGAVPSAKVKGYVFTVLSNEVNTMLRSVIEHEDIAERWDIADEDNAIERVEKRADGTLTAEIMKLDEKYRAVLFLRYSMDMTVKEISEILGIPEKTVYTRLERAIKKLRA